MATTSPKGKRPYRMVKRAASTEQTRQRIIDVALKLWRERWYDEITLREVAARAGVSLRTVVNHFSAKEAIFAAALESPVEEELMTRLEARPDDIVGAIRLLSQDYENVGDATIRTLALEGRIPALDATIERGRELQRGWVKDTFPAALSGSRGGARERQIDLLVCATGVYTWKILRRDRGLSRAQTEVAIRQLVEALHR
jgi:AcrR family transcriptional regulator